MNFGAKFRILVFPDEIATVSTTTFEWEEDCEQCFMSYGIHQNYVFGNLTITVVILLRNFQVVLPAH